MHTATMGTRKPYYSVHVICELILDNPSSPPLKVILTGLEAFLVDKLINRVHIFTDCVIYTHAHDTLPTTHSSLLYLVEAATPMDSHPPVGTGLPPMQTTGM